MSCGVVDPPLKAWALAKPDVLVIEYHTWWPFVGDPFYQANEAEARDRVFYYNIVTLPSIQFDGTHSPPLLDPASYESLYQQRKALASSALIEFGGSYDASTRSGEVTATVTTESSLPGDWRLRIAIIESSIDLPAPNGILTHDDIFRRFVPDHQGTAIRLSGPLLDPVVVTRVFQLDSSWEVSNIKLVALLQQEDSHEIEQNVQIGIDELVPVEPTTWGSIKASFR